MSPRFTTFAGEPVGPEWAAPLRPAAWTPPPAGGGGTALGDAHRREAWRLPLRTGFGARRILAGAGAVVARSATAWVLCGDDGTPRGRGETAATGMAIDDGRRALWLGTPAGVLSARRLDTGGEACAMWAYFGEGHDRVLIDPVDSRLLVASVERRVPHSPPPRLSVIELHALPETLENDPETLLLVGSQRTADLVINAAPIAVARSGALLALGGPGWLAFASAETLCVASLWTGDFRVEALTAHDERVSLVVATEGRRELWQVAPSGEWVLRWVVGPGEVLVGPDGRGFLIRERWLWAAHPEDERRSWVREVAAPIAGAAVTADGWLVVAAGREVLAYDSEGEVRLVYRADAPLTTAPCLAPDGKLLVASETELIALA